MITVDAPGKLYIAGEYAVLAPGGAAVLVAVDRYLTVRLSPVPVRRTVTSAFTADRPVELVRHDGRSGVAGGTDPRVAAALRNLLVAVDLVDRCAAELGHAPIGFELEIRSQLNDDRSGRKFGLGSSGALTVAAIRALARAYRLGLDDDALLRLALLAAFTIDPRCSGGDVAASMLGGWVAYRAPDRRRVAELAADPETTVSGLVGQPWPRLCARRLPAPRTIDLAVGWSGSPAVSSGIVERMRDGLAGDRTAWERFVTASNACVAALIVALENGEDRSVAAAVANAGALLRAVSKRAGVVTETAELATLRRTAEALGAVAKTSGAGGGDCGIALIAPAGRARLHTRWRDCGIQPLDLAVHQSDRKEGASR